MTNCSYCGSETIHVVNLGAGRSGSLEARECYQCGLASLFPFPDAEFIRHSFEIYQKRFPVYDSNFEWKLFFTRRYFNDGDRVLVIGADSPAMAVAFKKEDIDVVYVNPLNVDSISSFADGEFNAVFIWDGLDFVQNIKRMLSEVKRVVKLEGYVSIRARDSYSRVNIDRGAENFATGQPNFMSRKFILRVYTDFFNDVPHLFMLDTYNDSFIVTLGKSRLSVSKRYDMKVLMLVHHYLFSKLDDATGPRGRVLNTVDMLERYGVNADVSLSLRPRAEGYDIVHLFHNAWETQDGLSQMISAREDNAKVVVSTIYMDPSETNFVINTIEQIFKIPGQDERDAYLNTLAQGKLRAGKLSQDMRFYAKWNIEEDQRALLEMADRLLCFSYTEMRQMSLNLNSTRPFSIVCNSANDETFGAIGPEAFVQQYGVKDFVIAAGHVEWRKNQLMLLYALRDNPEIPVVVVGAKTDDGYHELCKLWAHKNTIFISQLKHRHLASAFAAARVHALPSWIEGIALSTIEAAMCGCTPVVADRAGEIEYYGEYGYYANPGSVDHIRSSVIRAFRNHTPEIRAKTSEYIKVRYTFRKAVEMTIDAYKKTLGGGE